MSRAEILARYRILDRPELEVNTVLELALWRVDIHGNGDPVQAIVAKDAIELSKELLSEGDKKLALRIGDAAKEAQRLNARRS